MPANTKLDPATIAAISYALTQARHSATPLSGFPGALPQSTRDAYAIQNWSIETWPSPVAGFKVGGIPPTFRELYHANWLAGAIFDDEVFTIKNDEAADAVVYAGGFAAYEAEWVFVLDDIAWDDLGIVTIDRAKGMVTRVHMGMEIASSPMAMINILGPGAIISDFGNNMSTWLGPQVDLSVLDNFDQYPVRTIIDGTLVGQGVAKNGADGPLGALTFLLNHLREYRNQLALPDRLIVSSGAITGVHDSHVGTCGEIEFEGVGRFSLSMVAKPRRS